MASPGTKDSRDPPYCQNGPPKITVSLLLKLAELDPRSQEAIDIIRSLPSMASQTTIEDQDVRLIIDHLDRFLDATRLPPDLFRKCLRALKKMCGQARRLPSSYLISHDFPNGLPIARGGSADVWDGTLNGVRVAIKAFRISLADDIQSIDKAFCEEVVVSRRMSHPNLVQFLGVSSLRPFCMVSQWMAHGNVRDYVCSNPTTDRLKLLVNIARGLEFLHSHKIVHGDLKGDNILMNEDREACLVDFGLTSIISDHSAPNCVSTPRGTVRWMAPELFDLDMAGPPDSLRSVASDVYALAMVVIEVFTGRVPFYGYNECALVSRVYSGVRPGRPEQGLELGLSDEIWEMVQSCWHHEKAKRPVISSVLDGFCKATLVSSGVLNPELKILQERYPYNFVFHCQL